jgi:hypothetical protein
MFMNLALPIDYLLVRLAERFGNTCTDLSGTFEDRGIFWTKRIWLTPEFLVIQKYIFAKAHT